MSKAWWFMLSQHSSGWGRGIAILRSPFIQAKSPRTDHSCFNWESWVWAQSGGPSAMKKQSLPAREGGTEGEWLWEPTLWTTTCPPSVSPEWEVTHRSYPKPPALSVDPYIPRSHPDYETRVNSIAAFPSASGVGVAVVSSQGCPEQVESFWIGGTFRVVPSNARTSVLILLFI